MEEYESEYQQDLEEPVNSEEVIVQDLSKTNYMFNKAGCGITNEEANLIGMTMDQMSRLNKFKNIRYLVCFQLHVNIYFVIKLILYL